MATAVTLGVALAGASAAPSLAATSRAATGGLGVASLPAHALTRAGGPLAAVTSLLNPARLGQVGANLSTGVAKQEMTLVQSMGTHMMQSMPGHR